MKRFLVVLLCFFIFSSMGVYADNENGITEKEYELWAESPMVTCGITGAEARIYKALEQDLIELYPLEDIGENYYFAICQYRQTDGGYNDNTQTTKFYLYTLYATETGFIVLSESTASNECYWDKGYSFVNVSEEIDAEYYTENNSEIPYYVFTTKGKYFNRNMTYYSEYWFITNTGKLFCISERNNDGEGGYPYTKDGVMCIAYEKYIKSSVVKDYYMSDGETLARYTKAMYFKNNEISYGTAKKISRSGMTEGNGYSLYYNEFKSNIEILSYYPIPNSDNLYYISRSAQVYDATDKKYYFRLYVDVYEYSNGRMELVNSKQIRTKNTTGTGFGCKKINGLDESFYKGNDMPVPAVVIGRYAVITKEGDIYDLNLDPDKYNANMNFGTYNGIFVVIRTCNGESYIWKDVPDEGRIYYQAINEVIFKNDDTVELSEDLKLAINGSAHTGQNGYFSQRDEWVDSNFTSINDNSVKNWWGRAKSNVFPDGRSVEMDLKKVTGSTYEVWYRVYSADGTVMAYGPTGHFTTVSSTFDKTGFVVWTINNSKFVFGLKEINNTTLKEYYRVSIVEEMQDGEVASQVKIGKKNITPPEQSDTEVIQSVIDFGLSEIPLGYNIKENVIDSSKLDVMLREQVNSVRLNDIVVIRKAGYKSGEQNTGVTLNSYSEYDYSFGSSYIRLYTNGQYLRWYCNNPEDLIPGTYSKTLVIGDKKVYVTFKIVDPPTNEGSTTVVF